MIQATILLFVLALTVTPMFGDRSVQPVWCVFCGDRGASDFITNVILFLPVGAVFLSMGLKPWQAVVTGAAMSLLIELAQFVIPGRHSALGDLLSNSAGGAIGVWLWSHWTMLRHPSATVRWRLVLVVAAFAFLAPILTGMVTPPRYPGEAWWGQWTPALGDHPIYSGRVIHARIGTAPVASGRLRNLDDVRAALEHHDSVTVSLLAGDPPPGVSPIFAIANTSEQFILFFAADGDDLVLLYPAIATEQLHLTRIEVRVRGALAGVTRGQRIEISAQRVGGRWCVSGPSRSECQGMTAGAWWRLFAPGMTRESGMMDAIMTAMLFAAMAWLAPDRRSWIVLGIAALPALFAAFLPGLVFSVAPLAGALAGALLGRLAGVVLAPHSLRPGTRHA